MANRSCEQMEVVTTMAVLLCWLVASIALANITKLLYLDGQVCHGVGKSMHCESYGYPLAITCTHMFFCWGSCHVYLRWWHRNTLDSGSFHENMPLASGLWWQKPLGAKVAQSKLLGLASFFALSVAMGNASLKYIYPTFYQMLGSVSPLLTVIISMGATGKSYNAWTWFSMFLISAGMILCSMEETNFSYLGVALATGSTLFRCLQSVLQEMLLADTKESVDSITLLYYMAPYAGIFLLVASLALEGISPFRVLLPQPEGFAATHGLRSVLGWLLLSSVNAVVLNLLSNQVTKLTSAILLQVLGNVKNCIGILVSVAIFNNPMRPVQVVGMSICLVGIGVYQSFGASKTRELSIQKGMATS